jgi:hypothetical protein
MLKNACTNHPYIRWEPKKRHFTIHGKATKGLTTGLLKDRFYPHFEYNDAKLDDRSDLVLATSIQSIKHNDLSRFYRRPKTGEQLKKSGMYRGKVLGRNIESIMKFKKLFGIQSSRFGIKNPDIKEKKVTLKSALKMLEDAPKKPMDWDNKETYAKDYMRLMNDSNIHARIVWQELLDQKLILMHTEVPCGIEGIAATALDGIAVDENNRIVPLEFKTGTNDMLKHTGKNLRFPFQDQRDHRLNQALLQLGFGSEMFSRSNPHLDNQMERGRLIVSSKKGATTIPLPDWITIHLDRTSHLLSE